MIYQLNGKFGPFTLETDDDCIVLALLFTLTKDHSIYISHPKVIDQNLDIINFNVKIQETFNFNYQRYLEDNVDKMIAVLNDYVPGYSTDRKTYQQNVAEMHVTELTEEERSSILKMLRESLQYNNENLTIRINQVLSILLLIKLDMDNLTEAFAEHFLDPIDDNGKSESI